MQARPPPSLVNSGMSATGPVFICSEPGHGFEVGRLWERELYEQLRSKRMVVFICTLASIKSRWCFAELTLARSLQKPIFPLAVDGSGPHPLLSDVQQQTFDPTSEDPFAALIESMREADRSARTRSLGPNANAVSRPDFLYVKRCGSLLRARGWDGDARAPTAAALA
jgi:hypothetical protein